MNSKKIELYFILAAATSSLFTQARIDGARRRRLPPDESESDFSTIFRGALDVEEETDHTQALRGIAAIDEEIVPDPRIAGGSDAELGAYPHMVAALYRRKYFFCGGTLVASNVVLLAAHCSNAIDRVLIGRQDLSVHNETEEYFDIVEIARHPEFEWGNPPRNDYVLARLNGSSTRKPISLDDGSIIEKFAPNQELVMLGWGQTAGPGSPLSYKLQEGRIDYITNDECKSNFWGETKISDEMVCVYREGVSGCMGDSGGPLLWDREDDPVLVGVLSWGARKCSGYATVFAGVGNEASW
eukprot:CAMPEP_0196815108 /NCGR_PEP_ID=MMETSP1362-20130617/47853_1 /TAXON_ID=163516 /ORGANISM="Leptocylindrus danicus, Strain CCMP1856" /LENGTH=298 /DNA_ID=CAMNT_0042191959 /DNA_START=89 /DNA_END=982 /DNA_ORIENTATION=+